MLTKRARERAWRQNLVERLESRVLLASQLVKDINPMTNGSGPSGFIQSGDWLYFAANDGIHGDELWKTDGTDVGTSMVVDLAPGVSQSNPIGLTDVNGRLFFVASDRLWVTDGTSVGTVALGALVTNQPIMMAVGDRLFFCNQDADHGWELWTSDGTPAGTHLVKDISPGGVSSQPADLINCGGLLAFHANDGVHGQELWRSDGTEQGTFMVRDINPGAAGSSPWDLVVLEDSLYFSAGEGIHGAELWTSDLSAGGAHMVLDINPGTASSGPNQLSVVGSTLYFQATDPADGAELWKSDGTSGGTMLVKDLTPGPDGSYVSRVFHIGSVNIFAVTDRSMTGHRVWTTDGTPEGTVQLDLDGKPFTGGQLVAGGYLYYLIDGGFPSTDLWRTDGTAAGTQHVATSVPPPYGGTRNMAEYRGSLYVGSPTPGHWVDLCRVDDDSPSPKIVSVVDKTTGDSLPLYTVRGKDSVFFLARDTSGVYQLWKSDGTESGTSLVKAIGDGWGFGNGSGPYSFVAGDADGTLFFKYKTQLWKSDGTADGTTLIKDVAINGEALVYTMTAVGKTMFFDNWGELWKSDGTPEGTGLVKDIGPDYAYIGGLTNVNGTLYFGATDGVHGSELWKSDGTEQGTVLVKDIAADAADSSPQSLMDVNGTLYFTATTPESGWQIWKSDGTAAGTVQVTHVPAGLPVALDLEMVPVAGIVFFVNSDGELWKTDGTDAGTVRVKDIHPGPLGSGPRNLTNVNGTLFFVANDPLYGYQLFKSDGTESSAVRLSSTLAGGVNEYGPYGPTLLTAVGNMLYFAAIDDRGVELWRSDGTVAGTAIEDDLMPGTHDANPSDLVAFGKSLLYVARDPMYGIELRRVDAAPELTADAGEGYRLYEDQSIILSGAGSFSPDSTIVSYEWDLDFGWDGIFTSDATGPTAIFPGIDSPGRWVALRVTDALGRSHVDVAEVTVLNRPPTVSMSGSADPVKEGEPYTITLHAGDDPGSDTISSWRIDWGDGKVETIQGNPPSATHVYGKSGHFAISAAAVDEDGIYGTNGTIATVDDKFGQEGKVVHQAASNRRLVVLPDGKIVTAGGDVGFVLTRYNADGSVDSTFGDNGNVVPDIIDGPEAAQAIVSLQDGRLVVGGTGHRGDASDWVLACYLPNGKLDETFGDRGKLILHRVDNAADELCDLAVAGGFIYAAGSIDRSAAGGSIVFAMARLDAQGHLDIAFGDRGYAVASIGTVARAATVAVLGSGRILLTGTSEPGSPASKLALARFLPDGSLDPAFGTGGVSLIGLPTLTIDSVSGTAIQDTDKIVVVASVTGTDDYGYNLSSVIVRISPDGFLDRTFGKDGRVTSGSRLAAPAILSNGKIIISGATSTEGLRTIRLVPEGSTDGTSSGTWAANCVLTDFYLGEQASDVAIQPDGKIIVLGAANGESILVRYGQDVPTAWANVVNVAPKADMGADCTVNEGLTVTVKGAFTDPGYAETFAYRWHVTSSNGQVISDATTSSISFKPTDDGVYTVQFTVTDSAGASDTDTMLIMAANVAPTVNAGADKAANEGDTLTITPTITDPGTDTFTYLWHITSSNGQVIPDSTAKALTVKLPDDGIYTAVLKVTDDDGGVGSDTVILTARNVAPTLMVSKPAAAFSGFSTSVSLSSTDPGADTIGSWSIDWGDGKTETIAGNPKSAAHTYATAGNHTIRASAKDEDGTYTAAAVTLAVMPGPIFADGVLTVAGTASADTVNVLLTASACGVTVNGATASFPPIKKLVLSTGTGNDVVTLSGPIPDATVDLGDGSNTLNIVSAAGGLLTLQAIAGTNSINLSSGQLTLVGYPAPPAGSGGPSVSVYSGSTLNVDGSYRMRLLGMNTGARVNVLAGGDKLLIAASLSMAAGAALNLADSAMIINSGGIDLISDAIRSGRITGMGAKYTTLAAISNDKGDTAHTPIKTSFAGQTVLASDVLVKYAWDGDGNLDGVINADDYFLADSGYITQKSGYYNGDFNYDGVVNADDYFLIDSAFIGQSGPLATDGAADDTTVRALQMPVLAQVPQSKHHVPAVLAELFSSRPLL